MSKVIIALYVLTTSLGLIILKLGTGSGLPITYLNSKFQFNFNFYTTSGVVLYGLSFILYLYLIAKYDLGYIIPLATAFVYILIFVASFIIFREVFTLTKVIGISLIIGGLIFLNLKG